MSKYLSFFDPKVLRAFFVRLEETNKKKLTRFYKEISCLCSVVYFYGVCCFVL